MSTPVRILAFLVALAAVFAVALGVGSAVGPIDVAEPKESHEAMAGDTGETDAHGGGHGTEEEVGLPAGLTVTEDGYTLRLAAATARPGQRVPVAFTITGPDGAPVTAYDAEHEKRLHLIAVRRDLSGFQHVHPTLADDGTWTTDLALTPGTWRLFADFTPAGGDGLTLGADLSVAGRYRPAAEPGETVSSRVGDYTVTLDGELTPGTASPVTLTVSRDGEPVTDLQPYLGAYGHLVALREGDLAYLHVHPEGTPGDGTTAPGPEVEFLVEVPSAGGYRLYLDFRHDGVVRTAELALGTTEGGDDDEH